MKAWRAFLFLLLLVWSATGLSASPSKSLFVFPGYDGLGSVRYLTDPSGVITDTFTYDAFGILIDRRARNTGGTLVPFANPALETPPAGTTSAVNNYRYTGEQWDPDLGMYYLRARYYKPDLGRFWTMDSYEGSQEDPLSLHKYLYCGANPVNGCDPSGHETAVEMLSVSGIQGMLNGALGTLNAVARAYTTAQNILTVVDYGRLAYDFVSALTQSTPAGVESALRAAMQKHFGASSVGDITGGFQKAFDSMNGHWTEISEAIERKLPDIAEDAAKAMAADAKRIMQTKGRIEPVFHMPTGPGPRVTDKYVSFGKVHVGFSPQGGRLFGFGIMSNTHRASQGEVLPVLRIDYWDLRTQVQGRPTASPLHVHYHVGHETDHHPAGTRRTIWP